MQGVQKMWTDQRFYDDIYRSTNIKWMHFNPHAKPAPVRLHPCSNSDVCLPRARADGHLTFLIWRKAFKPDFCLQRGFSKSFLFLAFQEPSLEGSAENILQYYGKETSESTAFCCMLENGHGDWGRKQNIERDRDSIRAQNIQRDSMFTPMQTNFLLQGFRSMYYEA